jgi:hypothetical protein
VFVRKRSLRWADSSSRGVVLKVMCLIVIGEPHRGVRGLLGAVEQFCHFSQGMLCIPGVLNPEASLTGGR